MPVARLWLSYPQRTAYFRCRHRWGAGCPGSHTWSLYWPCTGTGIGDSRQNMGLEGISSVCWLWPRADSRGLYSLVGPRLSVWLGKLRGSLRQLLQRFGLRLGPSWLDRRPRFIILDRPGKLSEESELDKLVYSWIGEKSSNSFWNVSGGL
eukprot:1190044-Prorocentrum_minimum.AAC.5